MSFPAIAIDGPAASGKSTVAGRIAARLNYTFINTGAMYRAVAWRLLQTGVDPACVGGVEEALPALSLSFEKKGTVSAVVCEGRVLDEELRAPSVNAVVSMVAAVPAVRAFLVGKQREYNLREPVVMEGRDIGTAVFPDSRFKYFVTASEEVRAARRAAEGVVDSIAERDRQDASRAVSPLAKAPDALLVDTSDMTIDEVVDFIIRDIRSKL
ncbi:MAG: (d)CMP kinase [Akkermansiaceae bacterium]|nr:(d)CMP kinase [Akkermansia sp.]MCD7798666.1 (d)CMP kinase [Akkermansiaceae bacterium]